MNNILKSSQKMKFYKRNNCKCVFIWENKTKTKISAEAGVWTQERKIKSLAPYHLS